MWHGAWDMRQLSCTGDKNLEAQLGAVFWTDIGLWVPFVVDVVVEFVSFFCGKCCLLPLCQLQC